VAVGTQGLQVGWVIVPMIPVYVVYVELAAVLRHKAAVLTGILLMDYIRVLAIDNVSFIDRLAPVSTSQAFSLRVS
jgi:hypothetical protein